MIILLVMEVTSKKKSVFYYWENVLTVCGEFNFRCVATTTAIRITGAQSKLVLLAVFQRYDDAPVTVSFYFMHLYPDLGVNISPVEFEVLGYFPAVACFPGELCPHGTVDHVGEGLEFIGRAWRTLTGTFLLKQFLTEINFFHRYKKLVTKSLYFLRRVNVCKEHFCISWRLHWSYLSHRNISR